jgi:hypothetical protein
MDSIGSISNADAQVARLSLGANAFLRLLVFASLAGFPVGMLALVGVRNVAMTRRAFDSARFDVLPPLLLAVVALLPMVCLALRIGRRTHVTWNDAGITEWENETVRTFIPRARARMASDVRRRTRRIGNRQVESKSSLVVQVSDDQGRRITVAWRDPLYRFGFGALPLWMRRRPVLTSLEAVEGLLAWLRPSVVTAPIEPDTRSAQRPMAAQSSRLHLAAVGLCGVSLYLISAQRYAEVGSGVLLIVAGVLLALAALRPIGEYRAVARDARRVAGAQPISFGPASDGGVLVLLADRRALRAELGNLVHSDALVHRRAGSVRAILDVSESSDAYRDAPAYAGVLAVDTEAERAERRRILLANALEIAGRAAHAFIVVMIGVFIATKVTGF